MRILLTAAFLLLGLMAGSFTVADPASILHGPTERGDLCSEHRLLYRRIDIIEEQVEKTVEYLYSEIDSLLDSISGASWALPSAPGAPLLDIFDDDSR
ncbi:placenta-specific protein 9 [Xenopus laevis]|uniref:Placenta-specific protein 9 n=1 Tax=Xenopus laevis TaxID=8355 RepID=A0A8J0U3J4_XENLA|nr:placenta-specific protein 9 [Xenopus laevis]